MLNYITEMWYCEYVVLLISYAYIISVLFLPEIYIGLKYVEWSCTTLVKFDKMLSCNTYRGTIGRTSCILEMDQ